MMDMDMGAECGSAAQLGEGDGIGRADQLPRQPTLRFANEVEVADLRVPEQEASAITPRRPSGALVEVMKRRRGASVAALSDAINKLSSVWDGKTTVRPQ